MAAGELFITTLLIIAIISGFSFVASASWYFGKVWALRRLTRLQQYERGHDNDTSKAR